MSTLWEAKVENYSKKMPTKEALSHSAVVVVKIDEAQIHLSKDNKSKAISFKVSNDEIYANTTRLYFYDKKGEQIAFQTAKLDRLSYLLAMTVVDFEPTKEQKKYNGFDYTVWTVPKLKGKEIGMFLDYKEREYEDSNKEKKTVVEFEIKDFFDPKTHKTSDEKFNEQEPLNYEYYKNKWINAAAETPKQTKENKPKTEEKTNAEDNSQIVDDDENFPF